MCQLLNYFVDVALVLEKTSHYQTHGKAQLSQTLCLRTQASLGVSFTCHLLYEEKGDADRDFKIFSQAYLLHQCCHVRKWMIAGYRTLHVRKMLLLHWSQLQVDRGGFVWLLHGTKVESKTNPSLTLYFFSTTRERQIFLNCG